uniref:Predicted protein n=1 Tax=Hordeum vulgare subsp. vulgare TaxID=112509 RepID=F2DEV6_HORVV|nr:predicted protein [Hordeum vulgare subsp. vulgare]
MERRTASPEGADIYLMDLDTVQLLLPPDDGDGDSGSPELAIEASSSYPCIDQDLDQHLANYSLVLPSTPELAIDGSSSPIIDWAALDKIPLYIGSCLEVATTIIPSDAETTMASEGAMSGSDLNEPLHRDNTCLQAATIASSPYASPRTIPSDATTNHVFPRGYFAQKEGEAARLNLDSLVIKLSSMMERELKSFCSKIQDTIQHVVESTMKTYFLQKKKRTITHVSSIPRTKFNINSYEEAIREILQVLRAACVIHNLPLAQTWATCAQQGKQCKHHSYENCRYCISTIDAACYVNDPRIQIFHEACSEHHLLPGQGVAGKAFATNQSCFRPDVGSSTEQEYPLSHHAKIFKLKGVMAIRLRSTRTGTADFVLEFFLPTDCEVENEQNALMNSLSKTVQCLCPTLRMVTNKEMEDDPVWEMNEINSLGLQKNNKVKKRKSMARRSPVWKSFTEVMDGDTVKAKCNHCGIDLCCDSKTHGTSSLANHLKICKLNPNNRITGPM